MYIDPIRYIVGVDEAGRGPVAGPVAVGAVAVPVHFPAHFFKGIRDSKLMPQHKREAWYDRLCKAQEDKELRFALALSSSAQVDKIGITRAVRAATYRSLRALELNPDETLILLDGSLKAPRKFHNQRTIVRGDVTEPIISAASVVAKVRRDAYMRRLSGKYPAYGFDQHKGYGTREHYARIRAHGICVLHRQSFLHNLTNSTTVQ